MDRGLGKILPFLSEGFLVKPITACHNPPGPYKLCCQGKRRQRRREGSGPKWVQTQLRGRKSRGFLDGLVASEAKLLKREPFCFFRNEHEKHHILSATSEDLRARYFGPPARKRHISEHFCTIPASTVRGSWRPIL